MLVCFSLWRIRGKYICAAHWSWEREGGSVAHFGPDFPAVQCVCTSKVRDIAKGLCTDPLDPKEATAARSFGYFVFLETIPTLSVGKCRSLRSTVCYQQHCCHKKHPDQADVSFRTKPHPESNLDP